MSLFVILTTLAAVIFSAAGPTSPDPDELEIAAVMERLAPLQIMSFADNREYCGYLLRHENGAFAFTDMVRGEPDGCTPVFPLDRVQVIASVHTHGAYDPEVSAEFPTVLDMQSDRREGINGYVSTPGGRLWFIDTRRRDVYQICGLGCLPQDPEFQAGDDGWVARKYSYQELVERESGLVP